MARPSTGSTRTNKMARTKNSLKSTTKPRRSRNRANTDNGEANKWIAYKKKINRLLLGIKRDEHYCNVLSMQKHRNDIIQLGEWQRYENNIRKSKLEILELLDYLASENASDVRYQILAADNDDDMVDVMCVNCSRCGLPEEDGNDILFCDRRGCNRAYHENCLDPLLLSGSVNLGDPDEDWFCWQCECVDDCLDMIGDILEVGMLVDVSDVFPALRAELRGEVATEGLTISDTEDEDDEDFVPSSSVDGNMCFGKHRRLSNRSDSSSDDSHSPDGTFSDEESLSDDEVCDLIADATSHGMDARCHSECSQTCSKGRYSLRAPRRTSTGSDDMFDTIAHINPDLVEAGQSIARVNRGYVQLGTIECEVEQATRVLPKPTMVTRRRGRRREEGLSVSDSTQWGAERRTKWRVEFDGVRAEVDWHQLRSYWLEYEQYLREVKAQEESNTDHGRLETQETVDTSNIISSKRRRANVDYVKLNAVMFGDDDSCLLVGHNSDHRNGGADHFTFTDDCSDEEATNEADRGLRGRRVRSDCHRGTSKLQSRVAVQDAWRNGLFGLPFLVAPSGQDPVKGDCKNPFRDSPHQKKTKKSTWKSSTSGPRRRGGCSLSSVPLARTHSPVTAGSKGRNGSGSVTKGKGLSGKSPTKKGRGRAEVRDSLVSGVFPAHRLSADLPFANFQEDWEKQAINVRNVRNARKLRNKYEGMCLFDLDEDVKELRRVVDVEWCRRGKEYVLVTELVRDGGWVAEESADLSLESYVINESLYEMITGCPPQYNSSRSIITLNQCCK